jgi:hypothetical protein
MTQNTYAVNELPAIYGRSKGLPWFDMIYKLDIIQIGVGGIGSHLALSLSRTGARLFLYDDDIFDDQNGGQVMFCEDIGVEKTQAIKDTISGYSPDCEVETFGKYTRSSETGKIVICGPDDITVRRMAFEKWAAYVRTLSDMDRKHCFFQDGRLLAEQYQIFNIAGDDDARMDRYYNEYLAGIHNPHKPKCTAQQTEYMAKSIAGRMMVYLTNWLTNVKGANAPRHVPLGEFYYQVNNQTRIIE